MKIRTGQLFLTIMLVFIVGAKKAPNWEEMTRDQVREQQQKEILKLKERDIKLLDIAKRHLISGETFKAKFFLKKIGYENKVLTLIKKRYLALIYFIDEDFEKSLASLRDASFNLPGPYRETCQLKILNMMILYPDKKLREEYLKCYLLTGQYSKNDQAWLNAMVQLHDKNFQSVNNNFPSEGDQNANDMLKTWMKIGIYTNREETIKAKLSSLPAGAYQSKKIRELAALIYYRTKEYSTALEFIEDIESTNAQIIKGNISLLKKEYEIAFGHFKLALKKKDNSRNALERAIPLAWILEQWPDGIEMLNKRIISKENERNIITLNTAFKIKQERFKDAHKQLELLSALFSHKLPKEIALMKSYVAAMLNLDDELSINAGSACKKMDGLNCWLLFHEKSWDDFSKTTKRDEFILGDRFQVAQLRTKMIDDPLDEQVILNQSDIEELDSALVNIIN